MTNSPKRRAGCLILIIVLLAGGGWRWAHRTPATSAAGGPPGGGRKGGMAGGPVPITVAEVKQEDFEEWVNLAGTVTPLNVVTVRSLVDGQLFKVYFDEGQMVKKDDLIAQIDPRPFQVTLDQARAALARDEALLVNANTDLVRYKVLLKQSSIPEQQVATQVSLVKQYEATIAADHATIASAELQLSYTKITSPLTGRAGLRQIDPGNTIHPTDANGLVIVTQMDPMGVVFSIPQELVASVRRRLGGAGAVPVEVLDKEMKVSLGFGKLITTDNQIDLTSGTLKLKAEFPNADGALFPNQFVIARLLVNRQPGATVAPAIAIQHGAKGAYAYVLNEDSTVSLRTLDAGATHKDRTLIADGLKLGDKVVTRGVDRLREGAKVEVIAADGLAAKPADRAKPGEHPKRTGDAKRGGGPPVE